MSNKKLVDFLETRYQKSFEIQSSKHIPDIGITRYSVVCPEFPDVPFTVDYRPKTDSFIANFEQNLWTFQSKKYVGAVLKKHFDKYALNASVRASADFDPRNIPGFEILLDTQGQKVSLNIQIHLFRDLTEEAYNEILSPIVELCNAFIDSEVKQSSFTLRFYDEQYFKNRKLSEYDFGFNTIDENHFEIREKDKCKHKILFRLYHSSPKVNADQIYAMRTTNPDELMFNHIR